MHDCMTVFITTSYVVISPYRMATHAPRMPHDDAGFNDCQLVIKSLMIKLLLLIVDSQTSMKDHNVSNGLIDSQLNSNDDDDGDDDEILLLKY